MDAELKCSANTPFITICNLTKITKRRKLRFNIKETSVSTIELPWKIKHKCGLEVWCASWKGAVQEGPTMWIPLYTLLKMLIFLFSMKIWIMKIKSHSYSSWCLARVTSKWLPFTWPPKLLCIIILSVRIPKKISNCLKVFRSNHISWIPLPL